MGYSILTPGNYPLFYVPMHCLLLRFYLLLVLCHASPLCFQTHTLHSTNLPSRQAASSLQHIDFRTLPLIHNLTYKDLCITLPTLYDLH